MTNEELQEIEARAEAATPGPWERCAHGEIEPCVVMLDYFWGRVRVDIADNDLAFILSSREDIPALCAEVRRLRAKCGEEAPEGTAIYHVTTNEYVYCPVCECEIEDPWDEPGTKNCDGGDWHGVIICRNCEAKIEVHSHLTHFWTARLYTEKEQQP